ncbi:MAG: hypothetical protein KAY65_01825 [Planctomycetes bacterium]|nr:hypothetical protein [Planctomycetota bacterium]
MLQTTFLKQGQLALRGVRAKIDLLTWRELAFVLVGGIALAGVGQLLGRTFHLAWPVPMSGSIAAALPRAFILLVILLRVDRFGALTVAGIAEVSTKLAAGFVGWWPMSLVVPLLAAVAGDVIWQYLRHLPSRRLSLILTGGSLCGARVLLALFFWTFLRLPVSQAGTHLALTLGCIVVINVVLGMVAGLLVSKSIKTVKSSK